MQGNLWRFVDEHRSIEALPRPSLQGDNQIDNAACVLAALSELECEARLKVGRDAIVKGLRTAFVPGRFQRIRALGRAWILDVAHNPDAARVLAAQLRGSRIDGRTFAVCAMLADKDVERVTSELADVIDQWLAATTPGARGLTATELAARAGRAGVAMRTCDGLDTALDAVVTASTPSDRIVVFGSFHTVGPAFEWLRAHTHASDRWLRGEPAGTTV